MTTNDEQYVPSEALLRTAWSDYCQSMDACNAWVRPDGIDTRAEFDRFLARVRRDAAREALDGLIADKAHMAALLRAENGGNVEDVLTHYRDTHYPEESP